MKKLLAATLLAATFATPAFSADMAVKARPIASPAYNWTGFYIGVNGGGAWGRSESNLQILNNPYVPSALATVIGNGGNDFKPTGGLAGGQIGYLSQNGILITGIEASIDWSGLRKSATATGLFAGVPLDTFNQNIKTDWLALFMGRLGFDVGAGWQVYATAGAAVTEIKYTSVYNDVQNLQNSNLSLDKTKAGWAVGAGAEYMIAPNWSVRGEYIYADFNSISGSSPLLINATGLPLLVGGNPTTFVQTVNLHENIARAAISYHFGAAPVVAKY